MISYNQSLIQFNKMDYEDKKKKVVAMLDVLREDDNIFQDLWDLIHVTDHPSESILKVIYQVVVKAMYSMQEKELDDAVDKLEGVKEKMKNIKEKEAQEEGDADELLDEL